MTIKEYVAKRKRELKEEVSHFSTPIKMVIVQVNDDPASDTYIRGKIRDSEEVGIQAELIKLPVTTTQLELSTLIKRLNQDSSVHGFIIQMPLPKAIDEEYIKTLVSPAKDIDGFHPLSKFSPCTPLGIINYLKEENIVLDGRNAVVIGRSNIVGKPMARLLMKENMNVTVLHSHTFKDDLQFYVAHADLIVIAIGHKYFLNHSFSYKKDAVLVDVGINRVDGVTYGDIEPEQNVRLQTPVPGGVGLLTRLTLLCNLTEAYKNALFHH